MVGFIVLWAASIISSLAGAALKELYRPVRKLSNFLLTTFLLLTLTLQLTAIYSTAQRSAFFAMIAIGIASAKAQCDMSILYENKLQEVVHTSLRMTLPDGENVLLLDDTTEYKCASFHLEQKGEYRIMAFFSGNESGNDSLEKSFILTGDEYSIETNLQFELKKNDFPNSRNEESPDLFSRS